MSGSPIDPAKFQATCMHCGSGLLYLGDDRWFGENLATTCPWQYGHVIRAHEPTPLPDLGDVDQVDQWLRS